MPPSETTGADCKGSYGRKESDIVLGQGLAPDAFQAQADHFVSYFL